MTEEKARDITYMDIREFQELGLLQEVNRLFFHPMGLALDVVVESDEAMRLGGIWDYRDNPEGMMFGDGVDPEKAMAVHAMRTGKMATRKKALGWHIQPAWSLPARPVRRLP